ncbi:MAG TPA: hypothetical protein ACFE0H_09995 [Elainellaceae cyanobacterium]
MRSLLLFLTIVLGVLVQSGYRYAFLIRYGIMVMLFFAFIEVQLGLKTLVNIRAASVLALMIGVACSSFCLLNLFDSDLALVAFMTAIAPTATAAPVVIGFLKGDVEYVTSAVVVTNCAIALLMPFLLPKIADQTISISSAEILVSTLAVVVLPLVVSQLLRRIAPAIAARLRQFKHLSFFIWLCILYLASSKAAHFISSELSASWQVVALSSLIALSLCVVHFSLGYWVERDGLSREVSQSLGHKNTVFSVWLCLTFLSPFVALGPMFYIVFQNLYNSYLLSRSIQESD